MCGCHCIQNICAQGAVGAQAVFTSSLVRNVGPSIGSTIDQLDNLTVTEVGGTKELASPWYSDQILPFDITIAGANEYGAMAAAKIFGVEILNEGWGSSIDDAVSEMQVGFVARRGWANAGSRTWSLPPVPSPASFPTSLPRETVRAYVLDVPLSASVSAAYSNMSVPKESTRNIFCNVLLVSTG